MTICHVWQMAIGLDNADLYEWKKVTLLKGRNEVQMMIIFRLTPTPTSLSWRPWFERQENEISSTSGQETKSSVSGHEEKIISGLRVSWTCRRQCLFVLTQPLRIWWIWNADRNLSWHFLNISKKILWKIVEYFSLIFPSKSLVTFLWIR